MVGVTTKAEKKVKVTKNETTKKEKTKTTKTTKTVTAKFKAESTSKQQAQVTVRTTHNGGKHKQPRNLNVGNTLVKFKTLHFNKVRVALAILLLLILGLHVACMASHYWLNIEGVFHQGLWRVCSQTKSGIQCSRFTFRPDYYKPIQAVMATAIAFYLGAVVYFAYMLKIRKTPAFVLTIIVAAGAVLVIVGLSIFTENNYNAVTSSNIAFGWSYYCGWGTVLLSLVSSAVALLDERFMAK